MSVVICWLCHRSTRRWTMWKGHTVCETSCDIDHEY